MKQCSLQTNSVWSALHLDLNNVHFRLTVTAPVPDVDPPAFVQLICISKICLLLCMQLSMDPGHWCRVERDIAKLSCPTQAEHRVAQRRPECIEVLHCVTDRRADPKKLKTWLHVGQHGVKLWLSNCLSTHSTFLYSKLITMLRLQLLSSEPNWSKVRKHLKYQILKLKYNEASSNGVSVWQAVKLSSDWTKIRRICS